LLGVQPSASRRGACPSELGPEGPSTPLPPPKHPVKAGEEDAIRCFWGRWWGGVLHPPPPGKASRGKAATGTRRNISASRVADGCGFCGRTRALQQGDGGRTRVRAGWWALLSRAERGLSPCTAHLCGVSSWEESPPGMSSSACGRTPIAGSVRTVGAWLDLQQLWGEAKDDLPPSKHFCPALTQGCRSPPARRRPQPRTVEGCTGPRVAGKGHLQPRIGKENGNSLHVDGASRGTRAGAGRNSVGSRDLNVSFLEARCKSPRRSLRRMSLFFILLAQLCWHLGRTAAEVTPVTAGAAPHPGRRLGLSVGMKSPRVR